MASQDTESQEALTQEPTSLASSQTPVKRISQEDVESDRVKASKTQEAVDESAPSTEATAALTMGADKNAPAESGKDTSKVAEKKKNPARNGVDPTDLKTLKMLYEENYFDQVEQADVEYPYSKELNDRVSVWRGDITKLSVDAIVNAANRSLLGGGGVDGAIHSAAGNGLYKECKTLDGAETGESKITGGYRLPAAHVIHTVGPVYSSSKKEECERLLRSCYQTTLEVAVANKCRTLAFSGISTGIYGYPLEAATRVALDVTRKFLDSSEASKLDIVIFTVFRQIDVDAYVHCVPKYFPPLLQENEAGGEEEATEEEGNNEPDT